MNYYDDNDNRTGRRSGMIATAIYFIAMAVLLLVVNISYDKVETGEGILVDFGDTDQAGGSLAASRPVPADNSDRRPADTPPALNPGDMMTQDYDDDAPEVPAAQPRPTERPSEQDNDRQEQAAPQPEERPREVDRRALFPGSAANNTSTSQGTSEGEGRQGSEAGTPGGDPAGTGAGSGGTGFSLSGRSIVGSLPQPRYGPNKSGRVVVDITVDANGKVIRAVPRAQGSNTNDSELVSAALDAAGKAQFNVIEGDGLQNGTITYNFILK